VEGLTSGLRPGPALRGLRRLRVLSLGDKSSEHGGPSWMTVTQPIAATGSLLRLPLGRGGAVEGVAAAPGDSAASPAAEGADAVLVAGGLQLCLGWKINGDVRPSRPCLNAGGAVAVA
jgi:hypothetical protein